MSRRPNVFYAWGLKNPKTGKLYSKTDEMFVKPYLFRTRQQARDAKFSKIFEGEMPSVVRVVGQYKIWCNE